MKLEVVQIPASEMANFSYVVFCPRTRIAVGVDPSMHPERMLDEIEKRQLSLQTLINTHGHHDHIAGNEEVLEATGAQLAAHPADLADAHMALGEGSQIAVGDETLQVMHTPGHTPGGITLDLHGGLITGDTLFVSRCGRADLPGSDPKALFNSLQRIKNYSDATQIFPGHDYGPTPTSTLAWEKQNNAFLRCNDLASFIDLRMNS